MHAMRLSFIAMLFVIVPSWVCAVDRIEIGSGVQGSNPYSVGGAICRMVNRADPDRCITKPTVGSLDGLYALRLTDVNFAIVQADAQGMAYRGTRDITGEYADLRSVASVYTEVMTVVTRADSAIGGLRDLAGLRVTAGPLTAGSHWSLTTALRRLDMDVEKFSKFLPQSIVAGGDALCAGEVDALVMMAGHPSPTLTRLGQICPIRVVALADDEIGALTGPGQPYRHATVPAGIYPFQQQAVSTIGIDATLVTLESIPDAMVDTVLIAIFGDTDAFRRQQNVIAPATRWDIEDVAPLHPAARAFYRESDPVH